jgi:hypothetical protein
MCVTGASALAGDDEAEGGAAAEPEAADADRDDRLRALEDRADRTERLITERQPRVVLSGYIDLGLFFPQGNGAGWVQDIGPPEARAFPEHADRYGWVFLGDILAPAVNGRGEPADLGQAPGIERHDTIASRGAPGFIANEVNLTLRSAVAEGALATASVNFAPRSGRDFDLGDSFDVDRAELEWMLGSARATSIFVGKTDGVLGIEYRERKAPDRFGVTPSLLARYTSGTPLGVKVRSRLGPGERVVVTGALANGSSGLESFHFADEIDSNAGKTASGRLEVVLPVRFELALGLSGEWGPQDHALDSRNALWFAGADARARLGRVEIKAEALVGGAKGETDRANDPRHRPWGLDLRGAAYLQVIARVTARLGVHARGELRDASVWLGDPGVPEGADRLYLTKSWRGTVGLRFSPSDRLVLKAKYLRNGEYGRVPAIPNDVLTSSLLLIY